MKNISIIIHTRNEESNIRECIISAQLLTSNIIVVDMDSSDDTKTIAINSNVSIKSFPYSQYVEPAREFGINQAQTDWVFILDADERMTKELANEIELIISNDDSSSPTYYTVSRKNIFGKKKWLKFGGWWPDQQIRLIYKPGFISWSKQIHSTPTFKGTKGELQNPILHYFHGDIHDMVEKTMIFEDIESDLLFKANKKANTLTFFRKFLGELYRRLIKHRGFMDGSIGIIESVYQAYSKTITYLFLYEKQHKFDSKKSRSL